MTVLLVASVALPAALALCWPWRALRPVGMAMAPWAAAPALALALGALMFPRTGPWVEIPMLLSGLRLGVDSVAAAFLLVTAFLWLAGGAFARSYHRRDPRREAFFVFFLLTMAGSLGLILAQDLVSFYVLFALMTFSAYGLVIHARSGKAIRAGRVYLALVGSAGGIGAEAGAGATVGFGGELEAAWAALPANRIPLLAGLLVAGFAVKAGIVPLHVWLPLAHPVAPTAASALLSGALIKAGLLGWLRVLPMELGMPSLGTLLFLAGSTTALYGVVVGLGQDDAKTVLAYSSVSHMGFMAMGTGLLVMDPALAPAGLAAVVVYALHHGTAKGTLFLSVGLADRAPRAGASRARWRKLVLAGSFLPSLALAGVPLTAGAMAKGTLSGVLSELRGTAQLPGMGPEVIELVLVVAAGGTTLLMARFLVTLDRRIRGAGGEAAPWELGLALPWGALLAAVGTAPFWVPGVVAVLPGAVLPPVRYAPVSAWLPVVVAGAAAVWVLARPGVLGPLASGRIPAGDLLVPFEKPLSRRRSFRWAWRSLDRLTQGEQRPLPGALLAPLAVALVVLLAAALMI